MKVWKWVVPGGLAENMARADKAILGALESAVTRSQLKRLIEEGAVLLNGVPLKPNSKLKAGSEVEIHFHPPKPSALIPEDRPIEILFEGEHLLVVNKPPGLTVRPSPTQMEGTLVHALLHHVKNLSGIGGVLRPGIVHRLDKNTSGALVISKTDQAHHRLVDIFSKHEIERTYWAICYGSPKTDSKIESLIGRNPADRKKMTMKVKRGKRAVTHFRKLKEYLKQPGSAPFAAWLEIKLETGRTHQIRVHLTGIGHSILGDPTYGVASSQQAKWLALPEEVREVVQQLPGQALHARTLGFGHPVTGHKLRFEAEPYADFRKLVEVLEEYHSSTGLRPNTSRFHGTHR